MTVFALGDSHLVNVRELNMNGGLLFWWISSLHVVQNSKHSYTFVRKLLHLVKPVLYTWRSVYSQETNAELSFNYILFFLYSGHNFLKDSHVCHKIWTIYAKMNAACGHNEATAHCVQLNWRAWEVSRNLASGYATGTIGGFPVNLSPHFIWQYGHWTHLRIHHLFR